MVLSRAWARTSDGIDGGPQAGRADGAGHDRSGQERAENRAAAIVGIDGISGKQGGGGPISSIDDPPLAPLPSGLGRRRRRSRLTLGGGVDRMARTGGNHGRVVSRATVRTGRQLLDLLCVALLGLILTLAAGAIRAPGGRGGSRNWPRMRRRRPIATRRRSPIETVAAALPLPPERHSRAARTAESRRRPRRRPTSGRGQSPATSHSHQLTSDTPCRSCHPISCGRWAPLARSACRSCWRSSSARPSGGGSTTPWALPHLLLHLLFLGLAAGVLNVYRTMSRIK